VPDRFIVTLAEDRQGVIWAGSMSGLGLYRITGHQAQNFGGMQVYSVFVCSRGILWIGSAAGLSWFQNGQLRTANSREGLPSDQIFAMLDDAYDRLWFATYAGLVSIEKKSLEEWAEGRRDKLAPKVYRSDAMQLYTVGRSFPNAVRSGDGHLWFSFADGVSEVTPPSPGASQENEFPVRIEGVTVDGIPYSSLDHLRIPPGARSIEVAYTAIALSNPESVRFRYRLKGLDDNWINADVRRSAFYNNLKPGPYTFAVS